MQEEKMHRSTYRVLKIFELLSATSEGMSLTGLAQRLEIPKGSLHPILKTMQAMNFIRMNDNIQLDRQHILLVLLTRRIPICYRK